MPEKSQRVLTRREAAQIANNARWQGRGRSVTIRVDPEVAEGLRVIPARDRRGFCSAAIRAALKRMD